VKAAVACLLLAASLNAVERSVPEWPTELHELPVLQNGRVKPFFVGARQVVRNLTGKGRFGIAVVEDGEVEIGPKAAPVDLALAIMRDPETWRGRPLILIDYLPLREELGVPRWASYLELTTGAARGFLTEADRAKREAKRRSEKLIDWDETRERATDLIPVLDLAEVCFLGDAFGLVPLTATDEQLDWVVDLDGERLDGERLWHFRVAEILRTYARQEGDWRKHARRRLEEANIWLSLDDLALDPDPLLADWPDPVGVRGPAAELGAAIAAEDHAAVVAAVDALEPILFAHAELSDRDDANAGRAYPEPGTVATEIAYERSRIFTWVWIAYLLGGMLAAWGLGRAKARGGSLRRSPLFLVGTGLTVLAILGNVLGFWMRLQISSWGAVTNFYETFIYVALVVAILGLVMTAWTRQGIYAVGAGIGAGLSAMVGEAMPVDLGQDINRLQPVLRSSFWLWVHVKTVVAAYGAFLLAWLLANIFLLGAAWRGREVIAARAKTVYRCLQVGVVLMIAGTLLGAFWADQAWGRFWGWDPKEVWALIVILVYLIPLHLRLIGVVGPTGLAAWSIYGFASVVYSWYGVNFLLGAGLHSYGFGTGGEGWVLSLATLQIVVTTAALISIKMRGRRLKAEG